MKTGISALLAAVLVGSVAGVAARDDRPTGRLWHNSYTLDRRSGVQVSPLDGGKPHAITDRSEIDVAVWPDGRQIVVTRSQMRPRQTTVVVMDSTTGKTIHHGQVPGYLREVEPSPTDRRLAKVRQGEDSLSPFEEHVLDLSTMRSRYRISDDDFFAWMPDGRFMLISASTRRMRIKSLDDPQEILVGHLPVPADRRMGGFAISPTGRQLMMAMQRRNSVPREGDLWIGNIDGSGFEQMTDVKAFAGAAWSPDGRFIAYTVDTGIACGGAHCRGDCSQWYTPVNLRKVQGLPGTPGSLEFTVSDSTGRPSKLGCTVLAWTR